MVADEGCGGTDGATAALEVHATVGRIPRPCLKRDWSSPEGTAETGTARKLREARPIRVIAVACSNLFPPEAHGRDAGASGRESSGSFAPSISPETCASDAQKNELVATA